MWMVKGAFYGVFAFVVFALFFFFRKFPISTNKAISLGTLRHLTYGNPWFWAALVLMICAGCACARLFTEIRS